MRNAASVVASVTILALVAALNESAMAQSSGSASVARAATEAAKAVTSKLKVSPAGPTPAPHGSDCIAGPYAAAADVARVPVNSAGARIPNSSTIVELPVERIRGAYLTDVRNATLHATVPQACALR